MLIAGVDIGGTSVKMSLFQPEKGLVLIRRAPTLQGSPAEIVERIARFLEPYSVEAIGVGTADAVDLRDGTVCASNLDWDHIPLQRMLSERLSLPVWVDNDAQTALMAEWYDGACAGIRDAVYLTLGTGIGGALLLDGRPWRGRFNVAAEFGHMITHADGKPCRCGRRGCFEGYASATALRDMSGGLSAKQVMDGARQGDERLSELFACYVHELCIGLANLNVIFTPEVMVLGGGLSRAGAFLSDACNRELQSIFAAHPEELVCGVTIARHQNDAGMLGAAVLAMEKLK